MKQNKETSIISTETNDSLRLGNNSDGYWQVIDNIENNFW